MHLVFSPGGSLGGEDSFMKHAAEKLSCFMQIFSSWVVRYTNSTGILARMANFNADKEDVLALSERMDRLHDDFHMALLIESNKTSGSLRTTLAQLKSVGDSRVLALDYHMTSGR